MQMHNSIRLLYREWGEFFVGKAYKKHPRLKEKRCNSGLLTTEPLNMRCVFICIWNAREKQKIPN